MRKQIAFIRPKTVPIANVKMGEMLVAQFPDCDVDVIDIKIMIFGSWGVLGINMFLTALYFGRDILAGRKKFREAFWRTPYIFKTVKRLLAKKLSHKKYWFTFQMQSLFDCSQPDTPHFIYTDHTHLANLSYPGYDRKKLYENWINLERQIYQNARITFVRSTNIRESLIEQYQQPSEKVALVYAGSNIEPDNSDPEAKSYSNQNILFVGKDWERKGGPELAAAFKLVLDKLPQASLTIVGSRPEVDLPNCQVLGSVPPSELNRFYSSAAIFCMPSRVEPFGIVYVEAMQAHLPIIASRVGAVPDLIRDGWNGILVEPGDVKGIASAITKLLADQELCRLFGSRNYKLSQERYSWLAVGNKIHESIGEQLSK